jgi:hypothetical protein
MLITEGLAELKTLAKRIEKKKEYIRTYLFRSEGLKDPLEKDGGSVEVLKRETQALSDLYRRVVAIRTAIQITNLQTPLTVEGNTKTIAEWLTWRKEVSDSQVRFVGTLRSTLLAARNTAQSKGNTVVQVGGVGNAPTDLLVNIDESDLAKQAEALEVVLGGLDGQLSLKNATVSVIGI